ncbi:MAG TPA: hypothetical protein VF256_17795, partial [Streptosporangiaceae bacterium]
DRRPRRGDHMPDTITPPGKARIVPCPECKGVAGRDCLDCQGTGWHVMRACPLCGDVGWDYVNGTDDRDGMACRISCGYVWTADDPGWRAQVLPGIPK